MRTYVHLVNGKYGENYFSGDTVFTYEKAIPLICNQGVSGSNPLAGTRKINNL